MHRIVLESALHTDNCFLTLTYSDEHLPLMSSTPYSSASTPAAGQVATLRPKDLTDFWKRLREAIAPLRIRYFAVGEYGDESFRPHYHAALFNFPTCRQTQTRYSRDGLVSCCEQCRMVGTAWGLGRVYLGTLEASSARYVAGYVLKKMTRRDDVRLLGREPEFSRMSNRPGIGHDMMFEVASTLMMHELDESMPDVPSTLRHGGSELPLGRYLTRMLRKMVGHDPNAPAATLEKMAADMQPLQEAQFNHPKKRVSLQEVIQEKNKGKVAEIKARSKIFKQRKKL